MGEVKETSGVKKIIILVVILVLPGFLYYLLEHYGENRYKALPIYGEKELAGTVTRVMGQEIPDTVYHVVPKVSLVNSLGEPTQILGNDTTISIVNFFYTRCETFCTHMNNEMSRVATEFQRNGMVDFYTVSVDTEYDTPEVLNAYATNYKLDTKHWQFLTGEADSVYSLARIGFLVDAAKDVGNEASFIHSSSLILVDTKRRIRGYYDVNHKKEVDRLIDEVKLLLVEEIRAKSPY